MNEYKGNIEWFLKSDECLEFNEEDSLLRLDEDHE